MYFVSGITGRVGSATAWQLLGSGHKVRSLSRNPGTAGNWSELGVEIMQGNFDDPAAVACALCGVEGAFLMLPPVLPSTAGFPEAKSIIASYVEALARHPPPRLVVLSSIGSQQSHGLGIIASTYLLESSLDDLPFPTAFIRAGSFMENFSHSLSQAASTGVFYSFATPVERTFPMVATADIGKEIARLLVDKWSNRRIVELGTRYSPNDLARALSEVTGRTVTAKSIPRDQWTSFLRTMGMSAEGTIAYEEMWDSFNSGWIDFGVDGTERVSGTISPVQVFAQTKKELLRE